MLYQLIHDSNEDNIICSCSMSFFDPFFYFFKNDTRIFVPNQNVAKGCDDIWRENTKLEKVVT